MKASFFKIPYYHDYISPKLAVSLLREAKPVAGVSGLVEVGQIGGLETKESLSFLCELYRILEPELARVLSNRQADRKFIDERVRATAEFNQSVSLGASHPDYRTVIGLQDANGRTVIGPLSEDFAQATKSDRAPIAQLPAYLLGPHVTLFGPPDSAKMSINAMNSYHRKLSFEPPIVEALLQMSTVAPMWGADDEDSKTPLRQNLIDAGSNLTQCFDGDLSLEDGDRSYSVTSEKRALPIKRFPGLALPSTFLFLDRHPIPLHLYDFALHLFRHWQNASALVFYVPKLENEEEAKYVAQMVRRAEELVKNQHPTYVLGSVRLLIVLENPRAILRVHEIIDVLFPYFAGASLGWHDYLASTARLFKEDSAYRIPVKADPNIVIKYIKASHVLLAQTVGSRGGIKIGGMYGILPNAGDSESWQLTLKGYFRDVVTQLKRNLNGFWVAHPDFVRLGLALVEAWQQRQRGRGEFLKTLVCDLLKPEFAVEVLQFIEAPDVDGLNQNEPGFVRSLIVADIEESDFIANNHPDEVRYNVFQSLQYLTDWLCGNGCVALPTSVDGTSVRVMDDLATAERSRWEVWHEVYHGRFQAEELIKIAHEELRFIQRDLSNSKKTVQVKWDARTAKWYPVALRIMLKLMLDAKPVEFATELLIAFTIDSVRSASDPWDALREREGESFEEKFELEGVRARFNQFFEICGSKRFARELAARPVFDLAYARQMVMNFDLTEIIEAAHFHGDIGQDRKTLDARAALEQAKVSESHDEKVKRELADLGSAYLQKFGVKFLISALGRSAEEIQTELRRRLQLTPQEELPNARLALWQISEKRLATLGEVEVGRFEALRVQFGVVGAQIAVLEGKVVQTLELGAIRRDEKGNSFTVRPHSRFQLASLSKSIAAAFAIEYFTSRGIGLKTSVQSLLVTAGSTFRLKSIGSVNWSETVTIEDLLRHTALNMHYVKGFDQTTNLPPVEELLLGRHGYEPALVISEPGHRFQYSGAGFMVLEHLIESFEKKPISQIVEPFVKALGLSDFAFRPVGDSEFAHGYYDSGEAVATGSLQFPSFAAGAVGSAGDLAQFLVQLAEAYHSLDGAGPISHDTAVVMLHAVDKGSIDFMGCRIGLGVFIAEALSDDSSDKIANRFIVHQGANDGFRALYLYCFAGPDSGKGFVVLCNADDSGVSFVAKIAQELLQILRVKGIDFKRFKQIERFKQLEENKTEFTIQKIKPEEIVNRGYRDLVFSAFRPDEPEPIDRGSAAELQCQDALTAHNLVLGAKIVSVTNDKFARAENLISPFSAVFDPELFGRQGKVMDSWESVRHNETGVDAIELRLKVAAPLQFVSASTQFHDGNHPEYIRIFAREVDCETWVEILPKHKLIGHSLLKVRLPTLASEKNWYEVRVEMLPDGGLTRLGLYNDLPQTLASDFDGTSVRFTQPIPKTKKPLSIPFDAAGLKLSSNQKLRTDWASSANGGRVESATNEHYGPAVQVISPFAPINMFDGLESARSRVTGHFEEVSIRLGRPTLVECVELDFTYFVNNNPVAVSIFGRRPGANEWQLLVSSVPVKAFAGNKKRISMSTSDQFEAVKVRTHPDGGIHRIKVYGPG